MKKSFFLVEDHSLIRQGVISYLCEKSNYECVGCSADTKGFLDFMAQAENSQGGSPQTKNEDSEAAKIPDVLITDLNLDGENDAGISLIRACHEKFPQIKIIVYSMHSSPSFVNSAIEAGAMGYVTKLSDESELRKAIESVMTGTLYVEPSLAKSLVSFEHSLSKFTKREISILQLVIQKYKNPEIAEKLGLNKRTVENNISRIYTKSGLNSREELLGYWKEEEEFRGVTSKF